MRDHSEDSSRGNELLPHSGQDLPPEGIDVLAIVAAMLLEWRLMVITTIAVTAVVFVVIFRMQSQYVAVATVMPVSDRAHTESIAEFFSARSPGGFFVGLLKSRAVADDIITHAHLLDLYKTTSWDTARGILASKSTFEVGADSILSISVKDTNSKDAAMLANAYVTALEDLNQSMTQDESRQLRTFFEGQLDQERDDLVKAETNLEKTQRQTGLIQPETQTQIGLSSIAATRAQITNLEVELAAMLQSETEQNPQVQRLRSQLAQLRAQEHAEEVGGNSPLGAAPPAGQIPQNNLDYMRAQREVKYHDTLVNSLTDQFEAARLGEATSRPAFQVIDRAIVPEHKSWPPRKLFIEIGVAFGILCGLLVVILRLFIRRVTSNPDNAQSLQAIRGVFGVR